MASGHGFIVCLYGLYDERRRSPTEMIGYRQYIDAVARHIAKSTSREIVIVLAGGRTTKLPISEAQSVLTGRFQERLEKEFSKRPKPRPNCKTLLEETSINTPQNISHAAALLAKHRIYSATIIVDRPRRFTAHAIGKHPGVMPSRAFKWDIISFRRRDKNPNSTLQRQLTRALRYFLYPKRVERELAAKPPVFK